MLPPPRRIWGDHRLPFLKNIRSMERRPRGHGFCWIRHDYDETVVAPWGLHLVYGGGYATWITFVVGFGRFNARMKSRHRKAQPHSVTWWRDTRDD